jgi:hypothetical protein
MTSDLKAWQRSAIRNSMANYRRAQENYYIKGKPLVDLENGYQAFSLLTPPLGSPAARRRVRLIVDNMTQSNAATPGAQPPALNARTPHVITVAVTYNCQCDCLHCSAAFYKEEVSRDRSALRREELQDAVGQAVDLGATCERFSSAARASSVMMARPSWATKAGGQGHAAHANHNQTEVGSGHR